MTEARGALWTGIVCFILAALIVFDLMMLVIEQLPGSGP